MGAGLLPIKMGLPDHLPLKQETIAFRTIVFGGLSKQALLAKLERASIQLNQYAHLLLSTDRFVTSETTQVATLIILSVGELGFPNGATSAEITERAKQYQLRPCPLELAPYFRLHYLDQIENNQPSNNKAPQGSITVLSEPVLDREDGGDEEFPKGFYLRHTNGQLWLRGYFSPDDYCWEPQDRFALRVQA